MHTERDVWSYGSTLTHADNCAVIARGSQHVVRGRHQAVDKARMFNTANNEVRHWTRSSAVSNHVWSSHTISLSFILIFLVCNTKHILENSVLKQLLFESVPR
jgi:hypothetical protein